MADAKYGRLFTEADLFAVVQYAMVRMRVGYVDSAGRPVYDAPSSPKGMLAEYERVVAGQVEGNPRMTFPADEPLFLLRGQDRAAPAAIADARGDADYLRCAARVRASADHLTAIMRAAEAMRAWQATHPDRVGVPD